MKATLEFNLPEDQDRLEDAMEGTNYKDQLEQVWQECFRPNRKHGYGDDELEKLIAEIGPNASELIEKLAHIYIRITSE